MSWRGLRYKGTEVLRSSEWNAVVDALNDLYNMVMSRRVDDPVHVASFYDTAKRQITEAVDASQLYNIWSRAIDDYGRVGVRIYEPVDAEGRVVIATPVELLHELSPVSATGSVSATSNTSGLTVQLNKGGRPHVNVYYALGGPGTVYVEVSLDGSTWRLLDTITLSSAGSGLKIYQGVAYPYIRVRTALTGVDVTFEIVASR